MKLTLAKLTLACGLVCFSLATTVAASASPTQIESPSVVNGEVTGYPRVKKNGEIWYPASVVGYYRSIQFSYDYANNTLYANGMETYIQSVVVDNVVYVNLAPKVTAGNMRPGRDSLALRRAQLKAMEGASPHMEGNTDALFMAEEVPSHVHPWAQMPEQNQGPIINLDPTSEEALAPHMRPGARPPEAAPEALPNRLPRPGETAARSSESQGTVQVVAPAETVEPVVTVQPTAPTNGIPLSVTTEGGPGGSGGTADVSGLIPIPAAPQPAPDTNPFRASGNLQSASGANTVFKVQVAGGTWQVNPSDKILRVRLQQQNLSRVAQSNLGKFTVRCADGTRVEASRTRSYLPDGTLDPGGQREGDLVFRFAPEQNPQALELEGALKLSVALQIQ
jgi:hypothetical protein